MPPLHPYDLLILDYYAARAPEYDLVYAKPERQSDLRAIEAWLPPVLGQGSVLEVACGTGYWTRCFAPHLREVLPSSQPRHPGSGAPTRAAGLGAVRSG